MRRGRETLADSDMPIRLAPTLALLSVILLILAACSPGAAGTTAAGGTVQPADIEIVTVSQIGVEHPFFVPIKNGADLAASQVGVTHTWLAPPELTIETYGALVDQAIAAGPEGLVLIYWDEDALKPKIQDAIDAGIVVVTMNTGDNIFEAAGVQTHVGQSEYLAGVGAGKRMASLGVSFGLCVNHAQGDLALEQRCNGFEDGMVEAGAEAMMTVTDYTDPVDSQNRIQAALSSNPGIDGILTTGTDSANPALELLREEGTLGTVTLATFDLGPSVLDAVEAGEIAFAIDQQQYLQGYLPIIFIANQLRYGLMPIGLVQTGPAFVTQDNVATARLGIDEGVR